MSSEDLIIRQYRNRIRKKVLSTMLVGLILSVLVFLDIQVGSSSIAFKDLVDAVLKGRAGGSSASFIVWERPLPLRPALHYSDKSGSVFRWLHLSWR